MNYSTLYANFLRNSKIETLCTSKGEVERFVTIDNPQGIFPTVIVTDGVSCYVQYYDYLVRFDRKGSIIWTEEIMSHMASLVSNGTVYYSNGSRVYGIDKNKAEQITPFFVPFCGGNGKLLNVVPLKNGKHLVQTYKLDQNSEPGREPENIWSLSFFDETGKNVWSNKYSDEYVPSVLTGDFSSLVLPAASGTVYIVNPLTGKERPSFSLDERRGIEQLCCDNNGNLIIFGRSYEGNPYVLKCDLKGNVVWEEQLASVESRGFLQPPAVDALNRAFIIHADSLICIGNNGEIEWTKGIVPDADFEFVTITGDNSALVASGNIVQLIEPDGEHRFLVSLPDGERISTPPILDVEGCVLVGTPNGVYRIK